MCWRAVCTEIGRRAACHLIEVVTCFEVVEQANVIRKGEPKTKIVKFLDKLVLWFFAQFLLCGAAARWVDTKNTNCSGHALCFVSLRRSLHFGESHTDYIKIVIILSMTIAW